MLSTDTQNAPANEERTSNRSDDSAESDMQAEFPKTKVAEDTSSPKRLPTPDRRNSTSFHILKNWETGVKMNDTLHHKAEAATGCTDDKCIGSSMNPDRMICDPRKHVRTKEQTIELSVEFIQQYYSSMKRKNRATKEKRLLEVVESIKTIGTYRLTNNELIFGAKTAWRNTSRCIGRVHWNNLRVFDARHVDNTGMMFDAICNHLKYGINEGSIQSCVTLLPPRTDDYTEDFRIWNPQLLMYAGYRKENGNIIGDPNTVEFTELCVNLGWKPKGGRFDVLPLLLQAKGADPDWYEIPKDLILEVELRHPRFDWFQNLGYKWFAVPSVSNMMFDIGGIEFPATTFIAWFMGTEISRNFCDSSRYNVLQEVANKMSLDTKNPSSLWKDLAMVEFNIAVLHSFQSQRVTIIDHHSACDSFMKHFANEMKTRGGCPADWVWLTPPISGSLTPIFHQEMLNYWLSPSCKYQPNPWNYHVWKGSSPKHKKTIGFKEIAMCILILSSMMRKAMAKRVKCTILYATETGKSLAYAESLKDIFNHAFSAKVVCMDEYVVSNLEHETLLLVVTSTFGNGDPPVNGQSLVQNLLDVSKSEWNRNDSEQQIHSKRGRSCSPVITNESSNTAKEFLSNLRFAIFGLGSSAYPHFCTFAHAIDAQLGTMGGGRLLEMGEGDELCGQEESFRTWAQEVFKVACQRFSIHEDVSTGAANKYVMGHNISWSPEKFRVTSDVDNVEPDILQGLSKFHKKNISVCTMNKTTNLQSKKSGRTTLLVEFDCPESSEIQYLPGDHICIYPRNQPELVNRVLERLSDDIDEDTPIQLQIGTISKWVIDKRLPVCTLRSAFERYLDINSCPTPSLLKLFADCAKNDEEKSRLLELAEGKSKYEEYKFHYSPNIPEVLEDYSSVVIEASLLLSQLPPLQCRYYSISSSASLHPRQVHLTVAVVNFNTQGGKGPIHHGVCSTYLNTASYGDHIYCFIQRATDFRPPGDPTKPILLIGPGTGIAPFRSFWQQREYEIKEGKACGEMALLFGCRHPQQDQLYKEEIQHAIKCGAITHYETAFSRHAEEPKQYVQDVLKVRISDMAYKWLAEKEGHVYICGDVTMADCVYKSLIELMSSEGKMDCGTAMEYVAKLKESKRLHEDIFGITLRTFEVNNRARTRRMSKKIKH